MTSYHASSLVWILLFLQATNPFKPSCFRASFSAFVHSLILLYDFLPCFIIRLDTTFPLLLIHKSFFMRPPLVYIAVPLQTRRIEPLSFFFGIFLAFRADFFLVFLGFEACLAFRAFVLTDFTAIVKFQD